MIEIKLVLNTRSGTLAQRLKVSEFSTNNKEQLLDVFYAWLNTQTVVPRETSRQALIYEFKCRTNNYHEYLRKNQEILFGLDKDTDVILWLEANGTIVYKVCNGRTANFITIAA